MSHPRDAEKTTSSIHQAESIRHGEVQHVPLKKPFSKLTMVGMAFAILNTWIALAGTLGSVYPAGGPTAFLYGFVFCVICNLCMSSSLGEMASVWPTAGGQYHWAFALCTEKWKKPISFLVGWISLAGWLTLLTTATYFSALFLQVTIAYGAEGAYQPENWHIYLLFMAISAFAFAMNVFGYKILGLWNEFALCWSVVCWLASGITILATSNKASAEYIFTDFSNVTGWPDGVAWILGLLQSALSFIGYDAVAHMTEEMPRPTRDAPIAMVLSVTIGAITGLGYILVMLFSITDPESILSNANSGVAIIEIIYRSTGSTAASVVFGAALSLCFMNGTVAITTSASRLLWALGRDNGTPASTWLAQVNPRFTLPINAIAAVMVFNILFGLLSLGPSVAFLSYISSCTIFLNCSYAAPILILLIRGRHSIAVMKPDFALGNIRGYFANVVSVVFVSVTTVFFMFPSVPDADASTMNYVSAVVGVFLMFIAVLWLFKRKTYQGPTFEAIVPDLDHSITTREEKQL